MLDNYHIITLTHQTINVDQIGNFVVHYADKDGLRGKLTELKDKFELEELVYLSTCNRVSYIIYSDKAMDSEFLPAFFKEVNPELKPAHLALVDKFVSLYHGHQAVNHLFELSSSVDSLVVGEREIFRQYREAYNQSVEWGLANDHLRLLDRYTVSTAKEVYANTKIGEKPLSIVALAIQKLQQLNHDINKRVILVGAGETNRLVGKFLKKLGYHNVAIFNRSLDNAKDLCELLDAQAYHISELTSYRKGFDILIVCTASTEAIISDEIYRNLIQREATRKIVVDLSVPHNVDDLVQEKYDMHYIGVEQLRTLAESNLEARKQEVGAAKVIIKNKLRTFQKVYQQRQIEKAFHQIPTEVEAVKNRAIESVYAKQIADLDEDAKALVMEMMNYMEKKCVGIPMRLAKEI